MLEKNLAKLHDGDRVGALLMSKDIKLRKHFGNISNTTFNISNNEESRSKKQIKITNNVSLRNVSSLNCTNGCMIPNTE